jgi:hypothetical protein
MMQQIWDSDSCADLVGEEVDAAGTFLDDIITVDTQDTEATVSVTLSGVYWFADEDANKVGLRNAAIEDDLDTTHSAGSSLMEVEVSEPSAIPSALDSSIDANAANPSALKVAEAASPPAIPSVDPSAPSDDSSRVDAADPSAPSELHRLGLGLGADSSGLMNTDTASETEGNKLVPVFPRPSRTLQFETLFHSTFLGGLTDYGDDIHFDAFLERFNYNCSKTGDNETITRNQLYFFVLYYCIATGSCFYHALLNILLNRSDVNELLGVQFALSSEKKQIVILRRYIAQHLSDDSVRQILEMFWDKPEEFEHWKRLTVGMARAAFPEVRQQRKTKLNYIALYNKYRGVSVDNIVPDRQAFIDMCENDNYWAGQHEIVIAAEKLRLNIWIYRRQYERSQFHHLPAFAPNFTHSHCFLVHTLEGDHFNMIARVPIGEPQTKVQFEFTSDEIPDLVRNVFFVN